MNADDFDKEMEKLIKSVSKKSNFERIGEFAANLIKKRTLLGYGVRDQGGKKEKLKALSAKYKDFRKKNPPTGPTTAGKSNLTYTGDMLNAVDYKVNGTNIEIGIFDDAESEKAFWNMLNDREFINLSDSEIKQVGQYIKKIIDEEINKL